MPVQARLLLLLLALTALLAGCGSDTEYATYKRDGVGISYPKGWKVDRRQDSDGGSSTRITPPAKAKTPYALILLSASPNAEKRFERQMKTRRKVIKTLPEAKIDSDKKIDVAGTKEAHRLQATVPPTGGTDPAEIKSDSLDLLRDNGDTLTVVVAAPQRDGDDELDPAKVIESLKLG